MGGMYSKKILPTNSNGSGGDHEIKVDVESDRVAKTGNTERVKESELYRIAKAGNANDFEQYVDRVSATDKVPVGKILSRLSPAGNTILHVAAQHKNEDIVKFIAVKQPFLVSSMNRRGDTALHLAAKAGHLPTVTALVEIHYNNNLLRAKNEKGNTALHEALFNNMDSVAQYLIKRDPELSYCQNDKKESAIYLAAKAGFVRCVSLILRSSTDQQHLDDELFMKKNFPIQAAIKKKKKGDTGFLDAMFRIISPNFTQLRDGEGRNPLHYAASLGDHGMASELLKKCSDYATQGDENGSLPIHLASIKGHVDVVKLLLQDCPDPVEELLDKNGRSILHVAAENGKLEVVEYVLKNTKNLIKMKDKDGNTALHLAAKNWKPMIVSTLTWDKNVNINAVNDQGKTALDVAETSMPRDCTNTQWLTKVALKAAGTTRSQSGTTIEKEETHTISILKEKANFRLLLSILVATVAFAAGFTLPDGHNCVESVSHSRMEKISKRIAFKIFVFSNIISMYSSISAAVVLSWAQSDDLNLVTNALSFTLPLFWLALSMMSTTFMAGVYLVINEHAWLHIASLVMGVAFHLVLVFHCLVVFNPITSSNRVLRYLTYYPFRFLVLVNSAWPHLKDLTWSNKH